VAHASKFIPTGSKRIELNELPKRVNGVAVIRPDKQVAVLLQNETNQMVNTAISLGNKQWGIEIPKEGVVSILLN
jgi:hypothetical protein